MKSVGVMLGFCFLFTAQAQQSYDTLHSTKGISTLKLGTCIPLQFDVQYHYRKGKSSFMANAGILTPPYSTAIVGLLKLFGTDEATANLIEDSFKAGLIPQIGYNYHFKRSYWGGFAQAVFLLGDNTPKNLVEEYYAIDLDDYIVNPKKSNQLQIDLHSNLYNIGFVYGYSFSLGKQSEIHLEFSIAKTVASKSTIYLNSLYSTALSALAQTELSDIYWKYSYIPSVNVFWVYTF